MSFYLLVTIFLVNFLVYRPPNAATTRLMCKYRKWSLMELKWTQKVLRKQRQAIESIGQANGSVTMRHNPVATKVVTKA